MQRGALSRSNIEVCSRKVRTPSGWRCIRPAKELRRIDRILSQWTDSEIASTHGAEARGIARLREIREALGRLVGKSTDAGAELDEAEVELRTALTDLGP